MKQLDLRGKVLRRALSVAALFFATLGVAFGQGNYGRSAVRGSAKEGNFGRSAVESFGLERNETPEDMKTTPLNLSNPFEDISLPKDLLRPSKNGRVQLFSVTQLSEEDLNNPFQVRVQVIVDMIETVFEIGGIIEGLDGNKNTVILLTRPPKVRPRGSAAQDNAQRGGKGPQDDKNEVVRRVYSVGDVIEGFRIHAIGRNAIILEQTGKHVMVERGGPVTISVPQSSK